MWTPEGASGCGGVRVAAVEGAPEALANPPPPHTHPFHTTPSRPFSRGFDAAKWEAATAAALQSAPRDAPSAHRAVRRMLAFGLGGDPYTRFVTPEEFGAMRK